MEKILFSLCLFLLLFSCEQENTDKQSEDSSSNKTVMAIFAHPDDELAIAPVLSKYAKEGNEVYLVIVTDGSKGVTDHANIPAGESLAIIRRKEATCSAEQLGIHTPIFLNYSDGELSQNENLYTLDDKIDSLFKEHKPNTVITFGPGGEYGHADHRLVSNLVTEVFQKEANEQLQQLLYVGFLKEDLEQVNTLSTDLVKWFKDNLNTTQKRFLSYRISVDDNDIENGTKAITCHNSQFTPEEMEDLSVLFFQRNTCYLRGWNGSNLIKENIFE